MEGIGIWTKHMPKLVKQNKYKRKQITLHIYMHGKLWQYMRWLHKTCKKLWMVLNIEIKRLWSVFINGNYYTFTIFLFIMISINGTDVRIRYQQKWSWAGMVWPGMEIVSPNKKGTVFEIDITTKIQCIKC